MRRAAIVSCKALPEAFKSAHTGETDFFDDDERLVAEFARRGVAAERVAWDDEAADWARYDLAVVRSAWDYFFRHEDFLARIRAIGAKTRVMNDPETVAWNSDKAYLLDLEKRGARIIPTALVEPGRDALKTAAARGWGDCVLKPRVGGGALGAKRLKEPSREGGVLQPFFPAVATEGEWSFVFLGGVFRYALLKTPKAREFRVQALYGGSVRRLEPSEADRRSAEAAMKALPRAPLYARVDMVRGEDGALALMELELIEPYLFFSLAPEAPAALADAALARVVS